VDSLTIAAIVFACTFGGAIFGMFLCSLLPQHHLNNDAKDIMKMGMGLIATMAALVLGLLIASAKSSFDGEKNGHQQLATNLIVLDRLLLRYGPQANTARTLLKTTVSEWIDLRWGKDDSHTSATEAPEITTNTMTVLAAIQGLNPTDDTQRTLKGQALQIILELGRTRWALSQSGESSIPIPFLAILVFWLTVLFISFGLFAPRNATVLAVLLVCALSVASALFLIVDLDHPTKGLFQISPGPMRKALAQLKQD
jgi:uncharacterized membrane protein